MERIEAAAKQSLVWPSHQLLFRVPPPFPVWHPIRSPCKRRIAREVRKEKPGGGVGLGLSHMQHRYGYYDHCSAIATRVDCYDSFNTTSISSLHTEAHLEAALNKFEGHVEASKWGILTHLTNWGVSIMLQHVLKSCWSNTESICA